MARKVNEMILAQSFGATSGYTPEIDDPVKIVDDMEINLADGANNYVGTVAAVKNATATNADVRATVATRFRMRKDDLVAGTGGVAAGKYFVPDGAGGYVERTVEDWTLVVGLAITSAIQGAEFSGLLM